MDQEKPLLTVTDDLEAGWDEKHSSAPARISRKMLRVVGRVVTRKHLVIVCMILGILFFTHHSARESVVRYTKEYTSSISSTSTIITYTDSCPTNQTNPHGVVVPPALEPQYRNALWNSLYQNFDAHPPSPKKLEQPHHGNSGFPPEHKVGSYFELTDEQAVETRLAHEQTIKELPDFPRGKFKGRGVVMLAGGRYSEYAATSLGMLREVGSELPVEVWVKDSSEETPHWCAELEREGMACRRLSDYMDMGKLKHPYAWKVFTLIYSGFSEILFLDADSMPVKNPDYIFDSDIYTTNGAILWPDYWNNTASPWTPYVTGMSDATSDHLQETKSVESGQIVWNKEKHWKSLLLTAYYNYWGPDYYYTMFNNGFAGWGDKDTFPIALQALQEPYHLVPRSLATAFVTGKPLGIGMLQADPTETQKYAPFFMHSNIVKWSARKFFCDDQCPKLGEYTLKPTHYANVNSPVQVHLNDAVRIFNKKIFAPMGVDPEPQMWRAMERAACRSSAWSAPQVCDRVRAHMARTFGYRFDKLGADIRVGPGNQVCLQMPAVMA